MVGSTVRQADGQTYGMLVSIVRCERVRVSVCLHLRLDNGIGLSGRQVDSPAH